MVRKNEKLNEALWGGGGYLFPSFPEINRFVPLSPKIKISIFYVPCSQKLPLFPCTPEIHALACSPKALGGPP